MILKLYALVVTDKMRLFEIDPNRLRTGYVLMAGGNLPATVHWSLEDADTIRNNIAEKSDGIDNFTIESVQIDALGEMVRWDIMYENIQEYKDFEIPKENQDDS